MIEIYYIIYIKFKSIDGNLGTPEMEFYLTLAVKLWWELKWWQKSMRIFEIGFGLFVRSVYFQVKHFLRCELTIDELWDLIMS